MLKIDYQKKLKDYLTLHNLRNTVERYEILTAVESLTKQNSEEYIKHFNADDIYRYVRKMDSPISLATVYRCLILLNDAEIIKEAAKRNGKIIYELNSDQVHHDHLICMKCGQIIEFYDQQLELLQNRICKKYSFTQIDHKHCIRGVCEKCKSSEMVID